MAVITASFLFLQAAVAFLEYFGATLHAASEHHPANVFFVLYHNAVHHGGKRIGINLNERQPNVPPQPPTEADTWKRGILVKH
ncbi:MAG: hypothetical protein ACUVSY_12105 [Roseiflexus sp.]